MICLVRSWWAQSNYGLSIAGLVSNGSLLMKESHIISKARTKLSSSQRMLKAEAILKDWWIEAKLVGLFGPLRAGFVVS
jgi:hypothetical protein